MDDHDLHDAGTDRLARAIAAHEPATPDAGACNAASRCEKATIIADLREALTAAERQLGTSGDVLRSQGFPKTADMFAAYAAEARAALDRSRA